MFNTLQANSNAVQQYAHKRETVHNIVSSFSFSYDGVGLGLHLSNIRTRYEQIIFRQTAEKPPN